jgi:hypothetical protein
MIPYWNDAVLIGDRGIGEACRDLRKRRIGKVTAQNGHRAMRGYLEQCSAG